MTACAWSCSASRGASRDRPDPSQARSAVPRGTIVLSAGLARRRITVTSRSARPIRVSSHYPFWRVNARLEFDRAAARGYRLDIPAGASVRWAPGQSSEVGPGGSSAVRAGSRRDRPSMRQGDYSRQFGPTTGDRVRLATPTCGCGSRTTMSATATSRSGATRATSAPG